jgi:hypothetical protein
MAWRGASHIILGLWCSGTFEERLAMKAFIACVSSTATVALTVKVSLDQPWDENCTAKQIYEQAYDTALEKLTNSFNQTPETRIVSVDRIEIQLKGEKPSGKTKE